MDSKEQLKSMLNNLIGDKTEEATLDLHSYLSDKMKQMTTVQPKVEQYEEE